MPACDESTGCLTDILLVSKHQIISRFQHISCTPVQSPGWQPFWEVRHPQPTPPPPFSPRRRLGGPLQGQMVAKCWGITAKAGPQLQCVNFAL